MSEKITYSKNNQNIIDDAYGAIREVSEYIHLHPHDHKIKWDWRIIFKLIKKIHLPVNAKILEMAGGAGNVGYYFARRGGEAVINDINAAYLKHAVGRHERIRGLIHDINEHFELEDKSFDLVCCLGTLHFRYVKDIKAVLEEMKRMSRGYILFDLFSRHSIYYNLVERILYSSYAPRRFSKKEAMNLIFESGLEVVSVASTRNIPILSKFFPQLGKAMIFLCVKKK